MSYAGNVGKYHPDAYRDNINEFGLHITRAVEMWRRARDCLVIGGDEVLGIEEGGYETYRNPSRPVCLCEL